MKRIKAIIFDLGNVVFSCSFDHAFMFWSNVLNISFESAKNMFVFDEVHEEFEKGNITINAFYNKINLYYNNKLSLKDFSDGWNSIYENVYEGIDELLLKYKNKYKLIALTNTNELHAQEWKNKYKNTLSIFDFVYSSNEIKLRKPDKNIYKYVLKENNLLAEECIFLDDNKQNIDSALEIGINSILIQDMNTSQKEYKIEQYL